MDGAGLTEALHARGINVRYLGKVAHALAQHPQLDYLYAIAVAELVLRAAKHLYTAYLQVSFFICMHRPLKKKLNVRCSIWVKLPKSFNPCALLLSLQ